MRVRVPPWAPIQAYCKTAENGQQVGFFCFYSLQNFKPVARIPLSPIRLHPASSGSIPFHQIPSHRPDHHQANHIFPVSLYPIPSHPIPSHSIPLHRPPPALPGSIQLRSSCPYGPYRTGTLLRQSIASLKSIRSARHNNYGSHIFSSVRFRSWHQHTCITTPNR